MKEAVCTFDLFTKNVPTETHPAHCSLLGKAGAGCGSAGLGQLCGAHLGTRRGVPVISELVHLKYNLSV